MLLSTYVNHGKDCQIYNVMFFSLYSQQCVYVTDGQRLRWKDSDLKRRCVVNLTGY